MQELKKSLFSWFPGFLILISSFSHIGHCGRKPLSESRHVDGFEPEKTEKTKTPLFPLFSPVKTLSGSRTDGVRLL